MSTIQDARMNINKNAADADAAAAANLSQDAATADAITTGVVTGVEIGLACIPGGGAASSGVQTADSVVKGVKTAADTIKVVKDGVALASTAEHIASSGIKMAASDKAHNAAAVAEASAGAVGGVKSGIETGYQAKNDFKTLASDRATATTEAASETPAV